MRKMNEATTGKIRPLTSYPVCLGETTVSLWLPRDLTLREAERIYRVMRSLCVDCQEGAQDL